MEQQNRVQSDCQATQSERQNPSRYSVNLRRCAGAK